MTWGASYAVAKDTLVTTSVAALIFFRFFIAVVVLLPVCVKELRHVARTDVIRGAMLGVMISFIFLAETLGVLYTSATNAAFLVSLCILFTPVFDSFLHRRLPPMPILGCVALCLFGTAFMVWNGQGITLNIGDAAILCAAVLRAMVVILTKRLFADRTISSSVLTIVQASVVMILSGVLVFGTEGMSGFIPPAQLKFWAGLMFLALFCTLAAFFIMNWAIRRTNPTRVGFLMGTEPLFGAVFAILLLGEVLTLSDTFGAILILCGTYFGARFSHIVAEPEGA